MTLTIRFQVSLIDSPAAGGAGDGCREWAGGANAAQNRPTDALPVTVRQRATDSATIAVKVISATRSVAMSLISVAFASIRRSRVLPAARTPAFAISVAAALGVLGRRASGRSRHAHPARTSRSTGEGSRRPALDRRHAAGQRDVARLCRPSRRQSGTRHHACVHRDSRHAAQRRRLLRIGPRWSRRPVQWAGHDGRRAAIPDTRRYASVLAARADASPGPRKDGRAANRPASQPRSAVHRARRIAAHFADRGLYPALSTVVVIGHSAGAQLLQRYAVAGHEGDSSRGPASRCAMWSRTRRATCISTTNGRTASRSQAEPARARPNGNTG